MLNCLGMFLNCLSKHNRHFSVHEKNRCSYEYQTKWISWTDFRSKSGDMKLFSTPWWDHTEIKSRTFRTPILYPAPTYALVYEYFILKRCAVYDSKLNRRIVLPCEIQLPCEWMFRGSEKTRFVENEKIKKWETSSWRIGVEEADGMQLRKSRNRKKLKSPSRRKILKIERKVVSSNNL